MSLIEFFSYAENNPFNLLLNVGTSFLYLAVVVLAFRGRVSFPQTLMGLAVLLIFVTTLLTVAHLIETEMGEDLILVASMGFSLVYLHFILRDVLHVSSTMAWAISFTKIPYFYFLLSIVDQLEMFGSPPHYLIFVPGVLMQLALVGNHSPEVMRSTWISAVLLIVGIFALQLDPLATEAIGIGTRFLWHIGSATVLSQLIAGYAKHGLAAVPVRG